MRKRSSTAVTWSLLCLSLLVVVAPHQGSRCPAACSVHGTCNEELARCDCLKGRQGPDCSVALTDEEMSLIARDYNYGNRREFLEFKLSCLNACNSRGKCTSGVCHCHPGHFGTDCSLSLDARGTAQLLAGSSYVPRATKPHVYVYELPPTLNSWYNSRRVDRPLHLLFWQRLLSSGARVASAQQADWFFIPVRIRTSRDSALLLQVLDYVRTTWPWWNRTHGADHFLFHLGDTGAAELARSALEATSNVTWLTHWGLHEDNSVAGWRAAHVPGKDLVVPVLFPSVQTKRLGLHMSPHHPRHPARLQQQEQEQERQQQHLEQRQQQGQQEQESEQQGLLDEHQGLGQQPGRVQEKEQQHRRSGQEQQQQGLAQQGEGQLEGHLQDQQQGLPDQRPDTLFFGGRVCGDRSHPNTSWPGCGPRGAGYSGQVRQKVFFHHYNRSGFVVSTRLEGWSRHIHTTRFCLAPPGSGHGYRQVLVALLGCIPVVVGDYIYQPFEPELDWSLFAVEPSESQIPQLHDILASIDGDQLEAMQRNLRCAAQHFAYSSITGGVQGESGKYDAFETILQVLRVKQRFPSAAAFEYADLDPEFASFLGCGSENMRLIGPAGGTAGSGGAGWDELPVVGDSGGSGEGEGGQGSDSGGGPSLGEAGEAGQRSAAGVGADPDTSSSGGGSVGGVGGDRAEGPRVCGHSKLDAPEESCRKCGLRGLSSAFGLPGGMICCLQSSLADCPRLWP